VEGVDFTYGDPRSRTGPNNTNTLVTLIPIPGSKLHQPIDVYYNRLPVSVAKESFYNSIKPVYIPSTPFWISSVLPEINKVFGLSLTVYDIIDTFQTAREESYTLIINPSRSLIWSPSVLEFKATFSLSEPRSLSNVIDREFIDGFDASTDTIASIFNNDIVNGFDATEVDTSQNLQDILNDTSNGFDTSSQELCIIIENLVLDGFSADNMPLSNKIISNNLDGFEGGDRSLRTCIYDTQLNGFAKDFEYS
jgi:hypothetical protein